MSCLPPKPAVATAVTAALLIAAALSGLADEQYEVTGPTIRSDGGEIFMEEITPDPLARTAPVRAKMPLDMSGLGVKVDPQGKIVPLIQPDGGGPVMPFYSNLQACDEPWWTLVPPWYVAPYGGVVQSNGYPCGPYSWPLPPVDPYTGAIPGVPTFQGYPGQGLRPTTIWIPGAPVLLY